MTDKHSPQLKFSNTNWKRVKLGDLYTERKEKGNDTLPILSVSIHTGISDKEMKPDSLGKTVNRSEDKSLYKHIYQGDLVLNMMRAWQGAYGVAKVEGMVSPAYITAYPNAEVFPTFMNYYLKRESIISQINNLSYGVTDFRKRLYWGSFVKVSCLLPPIIDQEKITNFFEHLETVISLHQQELDALKKTKQGFLQKMFPRNGEKEPVVRFEEYEGNWKQKKLGDILKVNSGRDYKHLDEGNIPVYGTGGLMLNVNESLSNEDAIGIGRKGTIDKPQLLRAPFWTVDTLFFMTMKKDIDLYFCFSLITRIPWKKYDESTGVPSLSKTNIDKIAIKIPNYDEQVKIGNFFKKLDAVIELKEQELEALKQTKQGFLQKMFV